MFNCYSVSIYKISDNLISFVKYKKKNTIVNKQEKQLMNSLEEQTQ